MLLRDCGGDAHLVHWSRAEMLPQFDAYVLPGGFAYEDRIRAGAIAAHDPMMDHVIDGAQRREARASASATARKFCSKPDSFRARAKCAVRPPRLRATARCRISSARTRTSS